MITGINGYADLARLRLDLEVDEVGLLSSFLGYESRGDKNRDWVFKLDSLPPEDESPKQNEEDLPKIAYPHSDIDISIWYTREYRQTKAEDNQEGESQAENSFSDFKNLKQKITPCSQSELTKGRISNLLDSVLADRRDGGVDILAAVETIAKNHPLGELPQKASNSSVHQAVVMTCRSSDLS
ncbi:MAG: hypothetical protein GKR96_05210 [Gammaproteobacteria bacterium]|nr:hypothetical protein [Gammaproteobacteria bacterium]